MASILSKKQEKAHYAKLSELGCIVCHNLGYGYSAPHIHHIRHGAGMGQKSAWQDAIPLCPNHHLNAGYGIALHAGIKIWEKNFGTEEQLLEQVRKLIYEA
jgi:Recombination enhancement, RecA-dependent nuclease